MLRRTSGNTGSRRREQKDAEFKAGVGKPNRKTCPPQPSLKNDGLAFLGGKIRASQRG